MSLLVADASAIAEYLLQTPRGLAVKPRLEDPNQDLHVPQLCDVEIAAVLRRALLSRRLIERRAAEALADYEALPLSRHSHLPLLPRVLELRSNFSACDAIYVALAERMNASLLTADDALARAISSHLGLDVVRLEPA